MSAVSKSLGRTVKTNIILYSTDNKGRDGYITYNNGGFWKDNIKQIKEKSKYTRANNNTFHSLIHQSAPFNYYSDGRGRDTYVIKNNAGLVKEFNPLSKRQILSSYLRRNIPYLFETKIISRPNYFLTPLDKKNYLKIHGIQKNVVRRLYDQCLEKFREKMHSESPSVKHSNNFTNTINDYSNINTRKSFFKEENKKMIKNKLNNEMKKNILKYAIHKNHYNNFSTNNENKKLIIGNLKFKNLDDNNFISQACKNIDIKNNKNNYLLYGNSNSIQSKFNDYSDKKVDTSYKVLRTHKNENNLGLDQNDISAIEKNKTMKTDFFKQRPKSFRRAFQKKQIFNTFNPFLVSNYE